MPGTITVADVNPFRLLYSVLPPTVANELRHGRPVAARRYEMVTLLFSGIVGFRLAYLQYDNFHE